jgi:hypothetical protein
MCSAVQLSDTGSHLPLAAHFSWTFLSTLQTNPSYTCTAAISTSKYSNYLGDLSYKQMSNQTFYLIGATNSTYGYDAKPCTNTYRALCEVRSQHLLPKP